MNLEVQGKQVLKVEEITTETQTAIVKSFYCYYYKTILLYDAVTKKVRATVYNHLDEIQSDFNEDIIFDYEGNKITITTVQGVATIDFNVTLSGEHTIKTANEMLDNGEVVVHVE